jgi:GTPase SAR1 family protein
LLRLKGTAIKTETTPLDVRLSNLETHLKDENPVLLEVVKSFRTLDRAAYSLGLLPRDESFATRVPWWPMISVLGTFSSGKSTFINSYVGERLQTSGNQAVDDKFTVICYGRDAQPRVLPGLALDADARFPFYQISYDIEEVAGGEGRRVDAYLQLKTCASENLRGKILIDSPGFDADQQRTSTLRITDHIINLSDLVLVFFDARHPEPGAMQDTLEHLVAKTISRPDSNKFLYILNQIDNTAREDNPEEVIAAWQRALAGKGLTAGKFYRIYDAQAAVQIDDPQRRQRFESKRDEDLGEIHARMHQVETERAYRIVGALEKNARSIEHDYVPALRQAKREWKQGVLWSDAAIFGLFVAVVFGVSLYTGFWEAADQSVPGADLLGRNPWLGWLAGAVGLLIAGYVHFSVRKVVARIVSGRLQRKFQHFESAPEASEFLLRAFKFNTSFWSPVLLTGPIGWNSVTRRRISQILAQANQYVQSLNDQFTDPSGTQTAAHTETSEQHNDSDSAPEGGNEQSTAANQASASGAPKT